jgi:uncharacterized SAM-binding protein YcdF (DUF218 family)
MRIFLSHINEEVALAAAIKVELDACFGEQVSVFLAEDIPLGKNWLNEIRDALKAADMVLVLFSRTSSSRPWVNIEAGYGVMAGKQVLPLCHSGFSKSDLPIIYGLLQAVDPLGPADVGKLLDQIAKNTPARRLLVDRSTVIQHWIEHISEALLTLNIRPPAGSELIERRKVDVVRWQRLSAAEQGELYQNFTNIKGHYHFPARRLAPNEIQVSMQAERPLELDLLEELRMCFAPRASSSSAIADFPITRQRLEALLSLREPVINGIESALDHGLTEAQYSGLRRLYDYLVAPECQPSLTEQAACDLIVVLGARQAHTYRMDAALQVANSSRGVTLLLSGGRAVYDSTEEWVACEADAMAHYLKAIRKRDGDRVIVDNRARTTFETAMHSVVAGMDLATELGRPITVIVVTSAYHVRRSYLIFDRILAGFRNIVQNLRIFRAASHIGDWHTVTQPLIQVENNDRRYAVGLFVVEYLKLIGGRASGEF